MSTDVWEASERLLIEAGLDPESAAAEVALERHGRDEPDRDELDESATAVADNGSWAPLDLVVVGTIPPRPATIGGGLFYPLVRHTIFGSHSAGKTWLCAAAVAEEIKAGHACAWVDVDGGNPGDLLERLQQLGLANEQISAHLDFYTPDDLLSTQTAERVRLRCIERNVTLAIIDSAIGSMSRQGLEPKEANAVENWWQQVGDVFKGSEGAVVLIDHTGHAVDAQGRPMDSVRKLQAVGVGFSLLALGHIGRGKTGRTKITIQKDRPTFHGPIGTVLGTLVVTSTQTGTETWKVTWTIEPPAKDTADHWRPTALMEKVSYWLDLHAGEHSRTIVVKEIGKNAAATRTAIDELVAAGYAAERIDGNGPTAPKYVSHIRPYRQADDPQIEHENGPDGASSSVQTESGHSVRAPSSEQTSLEQLNQASSSTSDATPSSSVQLRPDGAHPAPSAPSVSLDTERDGAEGDDLWRDLADAESEANS